MSTELDIADLIRRWEQAVGQGEAPSADELCRDCPELLQVLENEISTRELGRMGLADPIDIDPRSSRGVAEGLVADAEPVPGYRLVTRIGEGGTGEVWKAIGPGGFPVAMKFVRVSEEFDASSAVQRRRLNNLRSLELMREVRHPNLLPLFGAWHRDGLLIFVMELADRTLADQLHEAMRRGAPGIPAAELSEYIRQAACGIDHLNEPRHTLIGRPGMGIQHRDIKPQNLLLVGGCVKVGDFGQAKLFEDAVHNTGSLTAAYAPPELFQGLMCRQSDQYSLAVTYCELRGGRLPFVGNPLQVMMGHFQGIPDLTMIPAIERPAVARALAKRPAERWPDCRAFVEAIRDPSGVTESGLSHTFRPLALAPRPPARRRGRFLTGTLALTTLAALLLAGYFVRDARMTEPARKPGARQGPAPPIGPAVRVTPAPIRGSPSIPPPPPIPTLRQHDSSDHPVERTAYAKNTPRAEPRAQGRAVDAASASAESLAKSSTIAPKVIPSPITSGEIRSIEKPARTDERADKVSLRPENSRSSRPGAKPVNDSQPEVRSAIKHQPLAATDRPEATKKVPKTATIQVLLPAAKAELVVKGEVGRGNPDEWYGPTRVIRSPPMDQAADYLVGAFWLDSGGQPSTRSCALRVEPGKVYEVDLRSAQPSSKEVPKSSASGEPTPGK